VSRGLTLTDADARFMAVAVLGWYEGLRDAWAHLPMTDPGRREAEEDLARAKRLHARLVGPRG
jgi:hypothetical protein